MPLTDRYYKVVPEPAGSEPVPIVSSFADPVEADVFAELLGRFTGSPHIVAWHPSSDWQPAHIA